jgi:hypothetical protein
MYAQIHAQLFSQKAEKPNNHPETLQWYPEGDKPTIGCLIASKHATEKKVKWLQCKFTVIHHTWKTIRGTRSDSVHSKTITKKYAFNMFKFWCQTTVCNKKLHSGNEYVQYPHIGDLNMH